MATHGPWPVAGIRGDLQFLLQAQLLLPDPIVLILQHPQLQSQLVHFTCGFITGPAKKVEISDQQKKSELAV